MGSEAGAGFEVEGAVSAFIVSRNLIRYERGFFVVHAFVHLIDLFAPGFNFFGFIIIIMYITVDNNMFRPSDLSPLQSIA